MRHASPAQIIAATLMKSYIWEYVQIYELTINMRALLRGNDSSIKRWSKYLLKVGDGTERTYNKFGKND